MSKGTRFVGMDVHAETIADAVAEGRDRARSLGTIANRPEAIKRLLGKLGGSEHGTSSSRFASTQSHVKMGFSNLLPEVAIH